MKIAITGGIGSGKSAALSIIKEMGYAVFSADEISRAVLEDERVLSAVDAAFPGTVVGGELQRAALAERVFCDPDLVKALNAVLHPAIMQKLYAAMEDSGANQPERLVFAEVPLLFEGGFAADFDRVWVIMRGEESRIIAAMERDGLTREQIHARMKNQIDYSNTDFSAHTIIKNDGDRALLARRLAEEIEKIHQNL